MRIVLIELINQVIIFSILIKSIYCFDIITLLKFESKFVMVLKTIRFSVQLQLKI